METQSAPSKNVPMGVLAYIGPLVIISYLAAKNDPFVKFHIKQALVLVAIEVIIWVLGFVFSPLWMLLRLADLAVFVLAIIGIVHVVQGKEQALPIVGKFSRYFTI